MLNSGLRWSNVKTALDRRLLLCSMYRCYRRKTYVVNVAGSPDGRPLHLNKGTLRSEITTSDSPSRYCYVTRGWYAYLTTGGDGCLSESKWILLCVAFCTIMAISRQKEARSRDYVFLNWMISRVIYSSQYYRQHCTRPAPLPSVHYKPFKLRRHIHRAYFQ